MKLRPLQLRLTEAEHAGLREAARLDDRSMSSFARRAITREVSATLPPMALGAPEGILERSHPSRGVTEGHLG
jgi:hypothetical protein